MIHGRTCNLCEAMCGVLVDVEGGAVVSIKGDPDDPLSRGHICPKATALADLYTDADRLKRPLIKRGGDFEECSWEVAFDAVAAGLDAVRKKHGNDAVGVYLGNPTIHALGAMTHGQMFYRLLQTRSRFSATSLDQLPHMLAGLEMFGHQLLIPIPDLDRAHTVVVIGANPLASNGSIMSAPGVKQRLRAIQERGGRVIVIDPRKTETATVADEHHFIRPGTDAALLACLVKLLLDDADAGARFKDLAGFCDGIDDVKAAVVDFSVDAVSAFTGVAAKTIVSLADALRGPKPALVYGRFGACTQDFGGLTAWLLNVVNIVSGNLNRAGGVMFTRPAVDLVGLARFIGQRGSFGRRKSRVRGLPAFSGEFPTACLAEEIETPGKGQIRALVTHAGNPVLSSPEGARLERALPGLDFMVSIDPYLNETTRHASVILPPTSPLERPHYDLVLQLLAVRNTARWSDPVFPRAKDARHDWEIFLALARRMAPKTLRGRAEAAAVDLVMGRGPAPLVDLLLRSGPYRTSLKALRASKQGLDFGALAPALPERLQNKTKRIQLAPRLFTADVSRLQQAMMAQPSSSSSSLVMIGRRELRSNNSWMHNSERLVRGKDRCTVMMHPDDAAARALADGQRVAVSSATGQIELAVEVTDSVMPGVVSIPHGWGHNRKGTRLSVASAHAGASVNDVTDAGRVDALTGNASFSGTPVTVAVVLPTPGS